MDKKYQDIHYINNKSKENIFVRRKVEIRNISFKESYIEIDFIEEINPTTLLYGAFIKTIIIPKLQGHSLIID